MTQARSQLIDISATPFYHCVNRCVRRAFLYGEDRYTKKSFNHRKQWLVDRFTFLSTVFSIDIAAYAVARKITIALSAKLTSTVFG